MRRVVWSIVVGVVVAASAIAGIALTRRDPVPPPASDAAAAARRPRPSTGPSSSSTTTTTVGRRGSGSPVTLAFGGDVHFEGHLRAALLANPAGVLAPVAPVLSRADIAMVNLETAITERGSPAPKTYTFRAPAAAFDALRGAGVDVATMANNHAVDFGPVGLADTLAAAAGQKGLSVVGIGADDSAAYAPHRVDVRGQRIAVFGATDVLDDNLITAWTAAPGHPGLASTKGPGLDRLAAAVTAERPRADTIVVYLHWGIEGQTCPSPRQKEVAQRLAAAGADVIVGSHTHRLQGGGRLVGSLVAYGLGNFVWYNEGGPRGATGILEVTVTGRDVDSYRWVPARITGGVPRPLDGPAATSAAEAWAASRSCTGLVP